LYGYFAKSLKRRLKFIKLDHIYGTKGEKNLMHCENMLDFYIITCEMNFVLILGIFYEDVMDSPNIPLVASNFELVCDMKSNPCHTPKKRSCCFKVFDVDVGDRKFFGEICLTSQCLCM
jgi:hypothetical protein